MYMYTGMSALTAPSLVVQRGMALHKMLRLLTCALGGEAWLNFMGNEFGHPEWIDFPREGNGDSYAHARRQWSLCDSEHLRYRHLFLWDVCMNGLEERVPWMSSKVVVVVVVTIVMFFYIIIIIIIFSIIIIITLLLFPSNLARHRLATCHCSTRATR